MVKVLSNRAGYRLPAHGDVDITDLQLAYKHDRRVLELIDRLAYAEEAAEQAEETRDKVLTDYSDGLQRAAEDHAEWESQLQTLGDMVNDLVDGVNADMPVTLKDLGILAKRIGDMTEAVVKRNEYYENAKDQIDG